MIATVAKFYGGQTLNNGVALPIVMADAGTKVLPANSTTPLDCSGFNTLSVFCTITSLQAGNTFKVTLSALDPESNSNAAVPSNLSDVTLISKTASGSYAAALYLPSYYNGLTGLIAPFYLNTLTLSNTGGNAGNMNVTVFKVWLTNA